MAVSLKSLSALSILAVAALANPMPGPSATPSDAEPQPSSVPYIGHKGGNFQPSKNASAAEYVTVGADASWEPSNITDSTAKGQDIYTLYLGDGSVKDGWPAKDQWISFAQMWDNSRTVIAKTCSQVYKLADDSAEEINSIHDSIQAVAKTTGVDHRFILAVIMQESGGCVRVNTSSYAVPNPGLMQDHDGSANCNNNVKVKNPCPAKTIRNMIREGTAGTKSGDGLVQCINQSGLGNVADFYRAARIYNSGSIASSGNLEDGIATHCYSSDIANRLTGWLKAPHRCHLDDD